MTKRYLIKGAIYKAKSGKVYDNKKYNCYSPVYSGNGMYVVDCWVCNKKGDIDEGLSISPVPVMVEILGRIVGELETKE